MEYNAALCLCAQMRNATWLSFNRNSTYFHGNFSNVHGNFSNLRNATKNYTVALAVAHNNHKQSVFNWFNFAASLLLIICVLCGIFKFVCRRNGSRQSMQYEVLPLITVEFGSR